MSVNAIASDSQFGLARIDTHLSNASLSIFGVTNGANFRRRINVVKLAFHASINIPGGVSTASNVVIGTVPSGYRPASYLTFPIYSTSGMYMANIATTGVITLQANYRIPSTAPVTIANGTWLDIDISYLQS
jgi:hypothetical protein